MTQTEQMAAACSVPVDSVRVTDLESACERLQAENARLLALLETPEIDQFDDALPLEAAHARRRWAERDATKTNRDWFDLVVFLGSKALAAAECGELAKAKHHCISSAAPLRNWHARIRMGAHG